MQNLTSLKAFWQKVQFVRVTADGPGHKEACYLFGCGALGDSSGAGDVTLRDGHSVAGEPKVTLGTTTQRNHDRAHFNPPIFFSTGLYVDVGSNITSAYVQFLPETDTRVEE